MMRVPADFVGSVLGESEKKTAAILEEAVGRVLVIDEAYGLHSAKGSTDPYRVGACGCWAVAGRTGTACTAVAAVALGRGLWGV